ncbi:MAG TPA: flagellar hook-basal body complex protein FliE [Pirellulaceae bacterium]|nr:flagellar hook-basal body complex protein FliE [Pirellulaceae bacterium]HMO92877.1 flagellar hook-basal body complex protein FliE [Pirellulaceae bacterium]HMP71090.1 flagellar hook-basal body complex protein FliE [Pirellulaceae bacterium]
MTPLSGISSVAQVAKIQNAFDAMSTKQLDQTAKPQDPQGFGELLQHFVKQTNAEQASADATIESFVTGKTDNIQQVVMAMARADLSFQFFMEVRNKIIDSYNELMRMQF